MKPLLALLLMLSLAGCGAKPLNEEERAVLDRIAARISELSDRYEVLEGFDEGKEEGVNFVSYSRNLGSKHVTPVMNPNFFWVKASLVKNPIDPVDLQSPIVTISMPKFGKYLKLRMATEDEAVMGAVTKVFYETAMEAGGTAPLWADENRSKSPIRGRSRRSLAG